MLLLTFPITWVEACFILATGIQIVLYGWWYRKFHRIPPLQLGSNPAPDSSIIICARDAAEMLQKNLPRILNQINHSSEILVVNDNSHDHTEGVLLELQKGRAYFRTVNVVQQSQTKRGKKFALQLGVAAAKHKVLLLTDADCEPNSDQWIRKMTTAIRGEADVVLGFSPYITHPGFLNALIRYETVHTAMQYVSAAFAGRPYMGVGRNMAYHRAVWDKVGGMSSHIHTGGGDDDLLINAASPHIHVQIQWDPDTFVYSEPARSWKDWYLQKLRHVQASWQYRRGDQIFLIVSNGSHVLHYVFGLMCLCTGSYWMGGLGYILRIMIVQGTLKRILQMCKEQTLNKQLLRCDAAMALYFMIMAPAMLLNKQQ